MVPTDYFAYRGYRKIVLRMLMQAIQDLMIVPTDAKSARLQQEARDWVLYSPEATIEAGETRKRFNVVGLTFSDCLYALGNPSQVERTRQVVLQNPQEAYLTFKRIHDLMCSSEGMLDEARQSAPKLKANGIDNLVMFKPDTEALSVGG